MLLNTILHFESRKITYKQMNMCFKLSSIKLFVFKLTKCPKKKQEFVLVTEDDNNSTQIVKLKNKDN